MNAVAMMRFRGATAVEEIGPKPMLLLVLKKGKRVMHTPLNRPCVVLLNRMIWFLSSEMVTTGTDLRSKNYSLN